jgi:hypothetical protein
MPEPKYHRFRFSIKTEVQQITPITTSSANVTISVDVYGRSLQNAVDRLSAALNEMVASQDKLDAEECDNSYPSD